RRARMGYLRNPRNLQKDPAMKRLRLIFLLLLILPALPTTTFGQSGSTPKKDPPLATVDGQAITDDDLAPLVASQLRPLREQEYQIKKKALDSLISQKVVEVEAKKKGLTTEKLLEQEVDAKVPDPTDAELNAVYAVQREQLNRPFQEVKA